MPLNPEAVGATAEPTEVSWTPEDTLLYAVSVGAGSDELAFTTENSDGVTHRVLPTFAVVVGGGKTRRPDIGSYDLSKVLHVQQALTLHAELPTEATVTLSPRNVGIYDKGKAAMVVTEIAATLDGALLYTSQSATFVRGEGGWGGDRGPSAPAGGADHGEPDHVVHYATSLDQGLVYRLNGDRNPLHSDPTAAGRSGYERPILHGLCTYGFTGRALLHELAGGDPALVRHIGGKFRSPVFPGESLTIEIWRTGDGSAEFQTRVDDRIVFDNGTFEFGMPTEQPTPR